MATITERHDARIDLRMTRRSRETIEQAAALADSSLSDYIMGVVMPTAYRDIKAAHTIELSQQGWENFCGGT